MCDQGYPQQYGSQNYPQYLNGNQGYPSQYGIQGFSQYGSQGYQAQSNAGPVQNAMPHHHHHRHHHCDRAYVQLHHDDGWHISSIHEGQIRFENKSSYDVWLHLEVDENSSQHAVKYDAFAGAGGVGASFMGTGGNINGSYKDAHAFMKRAPSASGTMKYMIARGKFEVVCVPTHKMGARIYDSTNTTQISHHELVHTRLRFHIVNIGR
jgi:hypothetical protein